MKQLKYQMITLSKNESNDPEILRNYKIYGHYHKCQYQIITKLL